MAGVLNNNTGRLFIFLSSSPGKNPVLIGRFILKDALKDILKDALNNAHIECRNAKNKADKCVCATEIKREE